MNHVFILEEEIEKSELYKLTTALHDVTPAVFYGTLSLPDMNESWKEAYLAVCESIREKWSGVLNLSICFCRHSSGTGKSIMIGVTSNSSFSNRILDEFKFKIANVKVCPPVAEPLNQPETDDDIEKFRAPSELVQIVEDDDTVQNWIDSYLKSRRDLVNERNIRDFTQSRGCARVDAALVKRKDTTSHITVESVRNFWGPQTSVQREQAHHERPPPSKKKEISLEYLNKKLQDLQNQLKMEESSDTS